MKEYEVRSGQNIYDVALATHGSVEGVFGLLACNPGLSVDAELEPGAVLQYREELAVNPEIAKWLEASSLTPRNGHHWVRPADAAAAYQKHLRENHPEDWEALQAMPAVERAAAIEAACAPRILLACKSRLSSIKASMEPGTHMLVDWGDGSGLQTLEGLAEAEHCYKSGAERRIVLHGDFACSSLDLSRAGSECYVLSVVRAGECSLPGQNETNPLIATE